MMEQRTADKGQKRKRSEEGCSQTVLQGTNNCSAKNGPVKEPDILDTEAPARKKRKVAVKPPKRGARRQKTAPKPDQKRKRSEEGCSQTVLQGTNNCSAKEGPVKEPDILDTEAPARKKRKMAVKPPKRGARRQKTASKPDTFATRYIVGAKLGEGGFGSVFKGQRVSDGLQVAIKFAQKCHGGRYVQSPNELKVVPVEVALLQIMSQQPISEAIVQLIEWFDEPDRYILVLEYPEPCESLRTVLEACGGYLTERLTRLIMRQSVAAAVQCHERGVLHRDIKPENLLIKLDTMEVKLIDFGCGEVINEFGYNAFSGTSEYCPPEYLLEGSYHAGPATVWSLGVLMFGMVCGYLPFFDDDDIIGGELHFSDGLSDECRDLIGWCLQRNPTRRPNLQQIQQHDWFQCHVST